jgi:hypothetical protein
VLNNVGAGTAVS